MADFDSGKGSQLAHATNAFNYGHLGTAKYQEEVREWSFLRRLADHTTSQSAFPFTAIKRETVSAKSTSDQVPYINPRISSYSSGRQGFSLATADIKEDATLSSAILDSLDGHNPLLSDCLAFGSASLLLNDDVRSGYATIPVSALASGAGGGSITLTEIGMERVAVTDENDKDLAVKIPAVAIGSHNSWTGTGEAVQQICFAATTGYGSTWMAARLLSSTTLFHPLCHRKPIPEMVPSSTTGSGGCSLLDANPIVTIPISRTGGHPHADICFQPVDCHLLALIDQHGNWSTWRIDGKRSVTSRTLFKIQLLRIGKLYTWENLRRPLKADPYHDGWHKICWVAENSGYSDNVFAANRRLAVVYGSLTDEKQSINLGLGRPSESLWILDVKKSTLNTGWIFVLTSTCVFCISIANNKWRGMPIARSYDIVCSWQHFRARNDITLSMTILETAQCTVILLWSRINELVSVYRVNAPLEHPPVLLSWVEPSLLRFPDLCAMSDVQNPIKGPLALLIRPLHIQRPFKTPGQPLNLSLHKLFILQADRSVDTVLLQSTQEFSAIQDRDKSNAIPLPFKSDVRSRSSKYVDLEELDDFIVHDGKDMLHTYTNMSLESHEKVRSKQDKTVLKLGDWREVYEPAIGESTNRPPSKRIDFDDYVQAIYTMLEESASTEPSIRLLSELSSPLPLVADVEASSAAITFLIERSTINDQVPATIHSFPRRLRSENVLECYNSLVSHWLSPLPLGLPDRIRVTMERLARQVAADLTLASSAIKPSARRFVTQAVQEKIYPDSAPQAAVPSTSSIDGVLTGIAPHSQPASSHPSVVEEHPACLRLRSYTTVSSNAVTTAAPASVFAMLAHLPSATVIDPSTYDWRATEATVAAEQDEGSEKFDARARRRAEKFAQAKHKRTQLQIKTAEELDRQRVAPAIGSSQMVLPTREMQSSQVMTLKQNVPGDPGPMTQPERGTFGTRSGGAGAGRKDRGKQRTAGF